MTTQSLAVHLLPTGQAVHLRLLRPGETLPIQQVFDQMSPRSRFLRFHVPTPRLTEGSLRALAAAEPRRHVVVVAQIGRRAVGVMRWVRLHGEPRTAEISAAIGDDHQSLGLGRALSGVAARLAAESGVDHFVCAVHADNSGLRRALARLGARRDHDDPTVLRLPVARLAQRAGGSGSIPECSTACWGRSAPQETAAT
jgi:RimJ/RimL family protein N-acetyltransferase